MLVCVGGAQQLGAGTRIMIVASMHALADRLTALPPLNRKLMCAAEE